MEAAIEIDDQETIVDAPAVQQPTAAPPPYPKTVRLRTPHACALYRCSRCALLPGLLPGPQAWICLSDDAFPRKQCIAIVADPLFDKVVLILILLNCLTMTLFANPVMAKILASNQTDPLANSAWASNQWDLVFHRRVR